MKDKTLDLRDLHDSHTVTGLCEGLEHLKIETRLTNERVLRV
jgi:hypothetical protein